MDPLDRTDLPSFLISIELAGTRPPIGVVSAAGELPVPFTGWLGLLAALEAALPDS